MIFFLDVRTAGVDAVEWILFLRGKLWKWKSVEDEFRMIKIDVLRFRLRFEYVRTVRFSFGELNHIFLRLLKKNLLRESCRIT